MTAPHPRKGNRAVERKLHIRVADVLERQCLPQWRWAHITGCEPKAWPDFVIAGPLRCCFLQLPNSNGSMSKERSELAAFLLSRGHGYGLASDFDDAVAMLRDWGLRAMSPLPWFKFYPTAWMADPGLRSCSLAAQGLWIALICIMHDAKPYGHLLINGKRPSYYRISQIIGTDVRSVRRLMAQLEKAGVSTCTSTGEMTSRRMVRDKAKSLTARELSKKRWEDLPHALEDRKKEGPAKGSKGRKNGTARHRWETDLLRQYGPELYAKAIDLLAADPALVERATNAELRKPGSGVMAAMIGLRQHMGQQ